MTTVMVRLRPETTLMLLLARCLSSVASRPSANRRPSGLLLMCVLGLAIPPAALAGESQYAFPGATGRLMHRSRATGDRVPQFSGVGFRSGRQPLPIVPTVISVQPSGGDDTASIQAALDTVAGLPLGVDGFRGAVELSAGEFLIGDRLNIGAAGIVLRGAGDSNAGTVLRATGTSQRSVINVVSGGRRSKISSSERSVLDKYVPVGATSMRVADASSFSVGDAVVVYRPSTANWISELGMDTLPPRDDGGEVVQWTAGSKDLHSERRITRIEGERIFFDAPITNSLDQQYGGGTIYRYNFSNRLQNVGIENLKGISDYDLTDPTDEDHSWTFISVDDVEHAWVRGITAQHFAKNAVSLERDAKHVTVTNSHFIDPVSVITGSRRYAFEVDGQLNLVRDSTSDQARHDFIFNSPSPGPNVFLDNVATNSYEDSGPHQRWSTGGLFDNVTIQGDQLNVRNRGNFGTGHGWAGANMVIWNSQADGFIVQNPPTAQNWLIGSVGPIVNDTRFGQQEDGLYDHHGQPVETRSLYLQQLADRLAFPDSDYREYVLGDFDNYLNDGGSDIPPVTENLAAAFAHILTDPAIAIAGLDSVAANQAVPMSWLFGLDPGERVLHAVLSLALKRSGDSTIDDAFYFESLANRLDFDMDLGLTSQLSSTDSHVLMLEFYGPTDLAYFQDGEFNIVLTDDVALDWARLELTVAGGLAGDFNFDGLVNAADVDRLCLAIGTEESLFDLTGDGQVDQADFDQLIFTELGTLYGDANLDRVVDASDFNLWNQNKFSSAAGWEGGDFNCDGVTDASDFNVWNENKFRSAAAVPEPSSSCVQLIMLAGTLWQWLARRAAKASWPCHFHPSA